MILAEDGQTGELYIFDVSSSRVLNVHTELGLQPIYAYWAPDGQHLAFLRNREQTLSLELWPAFGWQPPKRIADGGPFYFDWRSDAEVVLFHSRSVGLLNIESGTTKTVSPTPASFGAPSWSFDNKWMAYADQPGSISNRVDGCPSGRRRTTSLCGCLTTPCVWLVTD